MSNKLDIIAESADYVQDVCPGDLPDDIKQRIQHAYIAGFASSYGEWNALAVEPNKEQAEAMLVGMGDELLRALNWTAEFYETGERE
jgi:hypothetical protein